MDEKKLEFRHGEVKWFDKVKRFGFIVMDDGTEIWFHFGEGRWPRVVDGRSEYGDATIPYINERRLPLPDPKPGEAVFFEIGSNSKGPMAAPWTFEYMLVTAWIHYEDDQLPCPWGCPHKMGDHPGGYCIHKECTCGDDLYDYEEPPSAIASWSTGPGGHEGYEG